MKKVLIILIFLFSIVTGKAQNVGIGTTTPAASSMLEIKASNKGLLIPRTSTTTRTAIVNPAKGLMLYDTTTNSFWYHNGTAWTQIGAASGNGWSLTGNAGTDTAYNFIGTIDAQSLIFKVNNIKAGIIDYNNANTGFGLESLLFNAAGTYNCAIGTQALRYNTSGISNTAVGYEALELNTGSGNTANGFQALVYNTTGYSNVAIGSGALFNNITGSNLTAIGKSSDVSVDGLTNATAIGAGAIVRKSNSIVLGNNANVGIGTSSPDASAQLDISSTSKGFLPPRMTSAQRDAIASPAVGLTIYNTTVNAFQVYNGTAWFSTVHFIGESYGGGIVFYVYDNGQHGLIAATVDQSAGIQWYNGTYRYTGTTGDGLNAGTMNTTLIVATQLADNQTGNFAAKVCADYSVSVGGITYGDWYLPSKYELNLLYLQKNVVGGFSSNYYWSSSEYDASYAWVQNFYNGFQDFNAKFNTYYVRAVRAF